MSITVNCWQMIEPKAPFKQAQIEAELEPGQVLVKVAGCGVCHTDLGFLYHGVRTKKPMPLTLGHEISGKVVETHPDDTSDLKGKKVVIPAVLPCGECLLCKSGRGNMCLSQIMPGNDLHGGFADLSRAAFSEDFFSGKRIPFSDRSA